MKISPFERTRQKQRAAWVHYALAFVGGTALALVFFVLLALSGNDPEPVVSVPQKPPNTNAEPPPPALAESTTSEVIEVRSPASASELDPPAPIENPFEPSVETGHSEPPILPPPPMPMPEDNKAPFADFPGDLFELPPRKSSGIGLSPIETATPPPVKIYVRPRESLKLQLIGKKFVFGADDAVELKEETEGQDRVWVVTRKRTSGPQRLGRFRLKDDTLSFAWEHIIPESAQPELLRYCLLEISVAEARPKVCRLSKPMVVDGWPLASMNASGARSLKSLDTSYFAGANTLLLEIRTKDVPASVKARPDTPITLGQQQEILIGGSSPEAEGARVGLLVQFDTEETNKSQGVIRVLTKVAFKEPKDKDDHVLIESKDSLQLTKLAEAAREARGKVKGFDTQLRRAQSETKVNREKAKSELKAFEERIKECESGVRSAKEDEGKQFWQRELQKAILRKKRYEESIDESERDVKGRIEAAEKVAERAEALLKLADAVCEQGRLEYRIFFKIGDKDVELYRTKRFDE